MACNSPLRAWRARSADDGKRGLVFNRREGFEDLELLVPCGQCMGCRVVHKQAWAIRAMHEAFMHDENCFITLTYAPEHLPHDLSLNHRHVQLFMKRLRKKLGKPLRYLMCGEYGKKRGRPHYHMLLFGHSFSADRVMVRQPQGARHALYRSQRLLDAWQLGHADFGVGVQAESAAYVAGYVTKKVSGQAVEELDENGLKPYELIDGETGEIVVRTPEYAKMSRRPGLGAGFYELFGDEVRRDDFLVINGKRVRVPGYYDNLSDAHDSAKHAANRMERRRRAKAVRRNISPERTRAKEDYLRAIMRKGEYDGLTGG